MSFPPINHYEYRRDRLRELVKAAGGQKKLATKLETAGVTGSANWISQILNRNKNLGEDKAREIVTGLKLAPDFFDPPKQFMVREQNGTYSAWPFRHVTMDEIRDLDNEQRTLLEGAMMALIKQIRSDKHSEDDAREVDRGSLQRS